MDLLVPFGSQPYLVFLALLVFSRGMDFLSTWIATPNLVLEANPIARRLGWKGGLVVNAVLCLGFALWPVPAIIVCTTSLLVAARNLQSAWLMRACGEEYYREWYLGWLEQTPAGVFLFCLFGQTLLVAMVGGALALFSPEDALLPLGIGMGMLAYAAAVLIYTLLAFWRTRRRLRTRPDTLPES